MTDSVHAAVILIGEELLSGKIDDLNGKLAIRSFRDAGIRLRELRCIGDEVDRIAAVVREASDQHDLVVTSGGIGPTHDDVTMKGLARAFEVPLVEHAGMRQLIERRFAHAPDQVRVWVRMAMLPEGCEVIQESDARLPIYRMRNVWALPGIPELFAVQLPEVIRHHGGRRLVMHTLYLTVGEGVIAESLEAVLEDAARRGYRVSIGSYPVLDVSSHRTRVTVESEELSHVTAVVDLLVRLLPDEFVLRIDAGDRLS